MQIPAATERIARQWDDDIVPRLVDYIRIPAKSPHFDPDWEAHGHIERVTRLAEKWARAQSIPGLTVEIVRLPGRTPVLLFEVPGDDDRTVLIYGHLDKQPEMVGWRDDGGPWTPIIENGRLFGRGGADDGYAIFSALSALGALSAQGVRHARCIVLVFPVLTDLLADNDLTALVHLVQGLWLLRLRLIHIVWIE